jgi:DNA-binding CsgD family transcriptional regulator
MSESQASQPRTSTDPVLIFDVDVAGVDSPGAGARRFDMRMVRSPAINPQLDRSLDSGDGEITAVLILRDLTPSRLASCVRAATRAGGSISPERLCQLLPEGVGAEVDPHQLELTDREYDVLRMLADGESTRGMAEQLSYSERTVKNIVHDLLVKLGCRTRAHAVALAARQGVI